MESLLWLRAQYAKIIGLPARLDRVADVALEILGDASRPMPERQRAARVRVDAIDDRVKITRILRDNLRVRNDLSGLGIAPIILIVGGVTAAAIAAALVAIFRRTSAYERELELLGAGAASVSDIERLRRGAPATGGVAETLRQAGSVLRISALAAGAYFAWKKWA